MTKTSMTRNLICRLHLKKLMPMEGVRDILLRMSLLLHQEIHTQHEIQGDLLLLADIIILHLIITLESHMHLIITTLRILMNLNTREDRDWHTCLPLDPKNGVKDPENLEDQAVGLLIKTLIVLQDNMITVNVVMMSLGIESDLLLLQDILRRKITFLLQQIVLVEFDQKSMSIDLEDHPTGQEAQEAEEIQDRTSREELLISLLFQALILALVYLVQVSLTPMDPGVTSVMTRTREREGH